MTAEQCCILPRDRSFETSEKSATCTQSYEDDSLPASFTVQSLQNKSLAMTRLPSPIGLLLSCMELHRQCPSIRCGDSGLIYLWTLSGFSFFLLSICVFDLFIFELKFFHLMIVHICSL